MFTREQVKEYKTAFWEKFRQKMEKQRSATGKRKNWLHYRSNIKGIFFRLEVTGKEAFFAIDIQMKDEGVRDIVWEQFMETRLLLESTIGNEMVCLPSYSLATDTISHRMQWTLEGVNLFNESDHERIMNFLAEKIKGLDEYWADFFDLFYSLCS